MYEMEDLHSRLLSIFKQFHNFCVENNIKYYAIGGTALGMKRHEGFIPWDDDVDIGIPRNDYDKLLAIADKLPQNLEILFYGNVKNSPIHYYKLVDKNTTLIEQYHKELVEGLYIDIFPIDGAIKHNFLDIIRRKRIHSLIRKILWNQKIDKDKTIIKLLFYYYCKCFDLDKMHIKLEKLLKKIPVEEGDSLVNLLGSYGEKECIDKKIFGNPKLYKFEDTYFFGPNDLNTFLICIYDNYLELPPIEKRIPYHNYFYLNLNLPYREYIKQKENESCLKQ